MASKVNYSRMSNIPVGCLVILACPVYIATLYARFMVRVHVCKHNREETYVILKLITTLPRKYTPVKLSHSTSTTLSHKLREAEVLSCTHNSFTTR